MFPLEEITHALPNGTRCQAVRVTWAAYQAWTGSPVVDPLEEALEARRRLLAHPSRPSWLTPDCVGWVNGEGMGWCGPPIRLQ